MELIWKHLNEFNELLGGDRIGMDGICFEPFIIADGSKKCHGLDPDVSIVYLDALVLGWPSSSAEGVEGKHGLIYPHQLHIPEPGDLDSVEHLSKEIIVVLIGIIDYILSAMDEFKLDPALLVSPLEKWSRDLDLWEGAMKHDGPLNQG